MSLTDTFGRTIKYLRLSVTDLCNYRCIYCMPENGVCKKEHRDILSIEELTEIVQAAYELGVTKVRLTGGEPLIRRGILTLCRNIKGIAPEIELSITTNGSMLPQMAHQLKEVGVDRLNVSLDTLDEENFRTITRIGKLSDTLDGIHAAEEAGFMNIKINTVLMNGVNDGEISNMLRLTKDHPYQIRFIELMPIGEVRSHYCDRFKSLDGLEQYLREHAQMTVDGVARVYRLPGHQGTIGLISPISNSFCSGCDKIRVTADGKLKPCLHSEEEIDLRGLHGEILKNAIISGVRHKPLKHRLNTDGSDAKRNMNEIGG